MAAIHWTPTALEDLARAYEHVAKESPTQAEKVAEKIFEVVERLESGVRSGWMVEDFDRDDLRELLAFSYRVIYRIKNEECFILSVLHGSRDIRKFIDPGQFD